MLKFLVTPNPISPIGQTTNGEDIYYLWGKNGEAFYTNKNQQLLLTFFFYTMYILCVLCILGTLLFDKISSMYPSIAYSAFPMMFLSIVTIYILVMTIYKKNMRLYVTPLKNRSPQRRAFFLWGASILFWMAILLPVLGSPIEKTSTLYATLGVLHLAFISYFCVKIHKTKGHYFSG